jgi:hypothetical protein
MTGKFGLGWFFSRKQKTRSTQSRRRANRPLRVEMLESKLPLAGNITATLAGGFLTLAGDANANFAQIGGTNGIVRVVGIGTTINGAPLRTFTGVTNIDFLGNGGSDSLTVSSLTLAGDLFASLDSTTAGNDRLTMLNVNVGGDIDVRTDPVDAVLGEVNSSAGADIVSLTNVRAGDDVFVVTGGIGGLAGVANDIIIANRVNAANNDLLAATFSLFKTGNGQDSITLTSLDIDADLFVDASPDFGNSSAADFVTVSTAAVTGFLDIRTDDVLTATSRGNDTATVNGVAAAGLRLATQGGNDVVSVLNSTFGDPPFGIGQLISFINTGAVTGADRDVVTITNTDFFGGVELTTGADRDFVTVTLSQAVGLSAIDVHTVIDLGAGDDYLNLSYNTVDDLALIELIGGAGTDFVYAYFNRDLAGNAVVVPQIPGIEFLFSL